MFLRLLVLTSANRVSDHTSDFHAFIDAVVKIMMMGVLGNYASSFRVHHLLFFIIFIIIIFLMGWLLLAVVFPN